MAITSIRSTTVPVTDPDKALDFYVNKLGLEKRADQAFGMSEGETNLRWIEVAPAGSQTVIILASGYGRDPGQVGKFAGVVFYAEDIQGTYEEMRSKGVKFTEPPVRQGWGMVQALFEDQDGNGFVLVGPAEGQ